MQSVYNVVSTAGSLLAKPFRSSQDTIPQELQPFTMIFRMALLKYLEVGTKISLSNHTMKIQRPGWKSSAERTADAHVSRFQLEKLSKRVEKAIKWYSPLKDQRLKEIFLCAVDGLKQLQVTYKDYKDNTVGAIESSILVISNGLKTKSNKTPLELSFEKEIVKHDVVADMLSMTSKGLQIILNQEKEDSQRKTTLQNVKTNIDSSLKIEKKEVSRQDLMRESLQSICNTNPHLKNVFILAKETLIKEIKEGNKKAENENAKITEYVEVIESVLETEEDEDETEEEKTAEESYKELWTDERINMVFMMFKDLEKSKNDDTVKSIEKYLDAIDKEYLELRAKNNE